MSKLKQTINEMNRVDVFAPYLFFPMIFLLYFAAGLLDFGMAEYFRLRYNIVFPIIVGLISYSLAVYLFMKKGWSLPRIEWKFLRGKSFWLLYLLAAIGLFSYLTMVFTGQIGLSDESVRRSLNPKLNFLSGFLWFAVLVIISTRLTVYKDKLSRRALIIHLAILAITFAAFFLMGYRTTIMVIFFTLLIVYHYTYKRIKLTWMLTLLVVLAMALSIFGFIRTLTEDTSDPFNSREGPQGETEYDEEYSIDWEKQILRKINSTPKWVRALTGESVTGRIVLSKLMEYSENEGYQNGRFHAAIFSVILPGEQISPRTQVTEMVNSLTEPEGKYVTRPGRTTTPTSLGQFYVEFGYIGIAIGFFLFGMLLTLLYNDLRKHGFHTYQMVGYAFMTTIFVLSIHTGLLDLIFILMLSFMIVTAMIERNKSQITN